MRGSVKARVFAAVASAVVALAVAPTPAGADPGNPGLVPLGERAAYLGNAGITSAAGEAAFYNPANLTRLGYSTLSVTGSLYLTYKLHVDAFLIVDGVEQPYDADGFVAIPGTLVSTYQAGKWHFATAVLVPELVALKAHTQFVGETARLSLLIDTGYDALWLGASAARTLGDQFSVGMTVFGIRQVSSLIASTRVVLNGPPAQLLDAVSSEDIAVLGAVAVFGAAWTPDPRLTVGLRAQTPSLRLHSSASYFQQQTTAIEGMPTMYGESERDDVDVDRPMPADVGVGVAYMPVPQLQLVADLNVQMPATLRRRTDEALGNDEQRVELTPRISLGAELELWKQVWVRAGAFYNPSTLPDPENSGDAFSEDFFGATFGLARISGRTETGVGVVFSRSSGEVIPEGSDPPQRGGVSTQLLGGLLSFSYRI